MIINPHFRQWAIRAAHYESIAPDQPVRIHFFFLAPVLRFAAGFFFVDFFLAEADFFLAPDWLKMLSQPSVNFSLDPVWTV